MTTAFTPPSELVSALMPKTAAALSPEAKPIPVGQLLKWGDEHDDEEVRDQAARARVLLGGLRRRHAVDQELTAIADERAQLEKRLAEVQAREAELAPPKKAGRRTPTSPDTKAARAGAAANGVDCPPRGRVPKAVMDAWRASQQQIGDPAA
ncbi:Lsr2 family DNA-binding protein [Streptomyces rochei]|uniref:Lsr2 family DNA-binding protein n=1 Tax=Streptomyces rochei TaxID=1928 RepID=UPI00363F8ECE